MRSSIIFLFWLLPCTFCEAITVFNYDVYLIDKKISLMDYLEEKNRSGKASAGKVNIAFISMGRTTQVTLNACKSAAAGTVDPKATSFQPPEASSLTRQAVKMVTTGFSLGYAAAYKLTEMASALLFEQSPSLEDYRKSIRHKEKFVTVEGEQSSFIPHPEDVYPINTLLHFYFQAPMETQYIVSETAENFGMKAQITVKHLSYIHNQSTINRSYKHPNQSEHQDERQDHSRRTIDFRSGFQPLRPLFTSQGSLMDAASVDLDLNKYFIPSYNEKRQTETVAGLATLRKKASLPNSFDAAVPCWLPELIQTKENTKSLCSVSLVQAREPDTPQGASIADLLQEAARPATPTDMQFIESMKEDSSRILRVRNNSGYMLIYSSDSSEWHHLVWHAGGVTLLLEKTDTISTPAFYTPQTCVSENQIQNRLEEAMKDDGKP